MSKLVKTESVPSSALAACSLRPSTPNPEEAPLHPSQLPLIEEMKDKKMLGVEQVSIGRLDIKFIDQTTWHAYIPHPIVGHTLKQINKPGGNFEPMEVGYAYVFPNVILPVNRSIRRLLSNCKRAGIFSAFVI